MSWSGSMFEYLMPSLVMRAPAGSLLEQTNRLIVKRQQILRRSLGIPWGISESAYNARDLELTYQYSNFGVPGLGLEARPGRKHGDRALRDRPRRHGRSAGGAAELRAPRRHCGASGRYGFYEALDFTPSRLPEGKQVAVVRNFMAHHQGMTIVAIANALSDGPHAGALPCRADDPGHRAAAAGADAARCRRRASQGRGGADRRDAIAARPCTHVRRRSSPHDTAPQRICCPTAVMPSC